MTVSTDHLMHLFRQWLESADTYAFLVRFVDAKSRFDASMSTLSGNEPEDLCHEFLLFVLDRFFTGLKVSAELIVLIRTSQFRRVLELAWGRFTWHRRELARNKQHNPRGYLYRRLREILQNNKQRFVVIRNRQGFMCYYPATIATKQPQRFFTSEDVSSARYTQWPAPPPASGQAPKDYLFSGKWLLSAADFFWQQVMEHEVEPIAIPIRTLGRYLADHHPWLNNPQRQDGAGSNFIEQLADRREKPEEHLQRINGLQSIGPLAAQLVATWPTNQQQVFALRLSEPPVKLEEIAERLGLADHNKVYALYQKAVQSLQRFIGNWPGLPLSDLPQEVAQAFIEEMKRLCKKSLLCP